MASPTLLHWTGLSNLTYRVETATNLVAPVWTTLGATQSPTTTLQFNLPPPTNAARYYRAVYP
jgi:hypothetical protein